MSWKTDFRSLYYLGAPEPDDPVIIPRETALLVIDVQNTYLERPDRGTLAILTSRTVRSVDALP